MSAPRLCGLERTAVLIQLAASIFYAQVILDQSDETHFEALTPYLKHQYIDLAALVVDSFKPAAVTTPSAGNHADLQRCVVEEGVARPVTFFEQAAALSRTEGARLLAFRGLDDSQGRD